MQNEPKPNVVFIYPDQMRYDAMGNSGNQVVKTPTFDRLANEGASFSSAYTSFPLCCPFRASFVTGKYAHNHGLYANHYPIPLDQEFLPEIMNRNGYRTGWIGKWHLNGGRKHDYVPEEYRCGYQHFVGFSRGHAYDKSIFYRDNDQTPRKSTRYESEYQTDHLIDFMDESLGEGKPFFASICYGPPHFPLVAPDHYLNMYNPEQIELTERVPEEDAPAAREFLAKYYGLITMVDYQVSRVLNWLDKSGIADNTMVIFVSDHGDLAGDYGRYNKKSIYDGSMHVPFIIRFPKKIKKGLAIDQLVDPSVDIFPTILDVCGISIPEYAEGISLRGQLYEEEKPLSRDYVYYQALRQPFENLDSPGPAERGIRTDKYLYLSVENKPFALFDVVSDPHEMNNLVDNAAFKSIVDTYDKMLQEKMTQTGDSWEVAFSDPVENHQSHSAGKTFGEDLYENAVFDD
jgi:arylsulfatase A-like enzyme